MRSPRTWGFVLRAADLRALSRRRFVLRFSSGGALLGKPQPPHPPAPPTVVPRRRR
jgi:hypothetical protein